MTEKWLSSPAIVWESSFNDEFHTSSYWVSPVSTFAQATQDENRNFLSYRDLIFSTARLAEKIYVRILPTLAADVHLQSSNLVVPVAVAIPEGALLPLSIAGVHGASHPLFYKPNCSFSVALVPLEPSDGRDRIKHVLQNANPFLVLTATDADRKRMEEILALLPINTEASVCPQGIYQCLRTEVVNLKEWLQEIVGQTRPANALDFASGCDEPTTLQETIVDCLKHISTLPLVSRNDKLHRNRMSHIVYTSGTTGVPKGCVSSVQSLHNYIGSKNCAHSISSAAVVLLASVLSFDPCMSDVLATFSARATLAIAPRDDLRQKLPRVLNAMKVTHCLCTPTLWGTMMGTKREDFPDLRVVALGGERIPRHIVRTWARAASSTTGLRLMATFGVTEACVYQTIGEVFHVEEASSGQDVGKPFPGMGIRICSESNQSELVELDSEGQSAQRKTGEIVLFGNQLDELSGYFHRPELSHMFIADKRCYYYRTGDRGYIDPNTNRLCVLGRIEGEEGMVKFKGIRVELGEIEAALIDCNSDPIAVVADAIVAMKKTEEDENDDSDKTEAIVGYIVLSAKCSDELNIAELVPESGALCAPGPLLTLLRERCQMRAKVTPSAFVIISNIPLSPTGKRNRRGVPSVSDCATVEQLSQANGSAFTPLRTYGRTGSKVADVIKDCLNLQANQEAVLTTKATFASLGGDSLAATRVTRALYAVHHGVDNSRHLGGKFGTIGGPFAAAHLLRARNLGDYVDWLDQSGSRWPDATMVIDASNQNSDALARIRNKNANGPSEELSSTQDVEAAELYDALLQAVASGNSIIAMALLDVGADPNLGTHTSRLGKVSGGINSHKRVFRTSPMHLACLKGLPQLVERLLSKGGKAKSPDASGLFPIHLAASGESAVAPYSVAENHNRLQCIKLLLQAGIPLTMKDANKQTVLHAAARAGNCEVLRYVLSEWKRNICAKPGMRESMNWRDRWSRTPVHWAILNGKIDALEVLVEMGCSTNPPGPKFNKHSSAAVESPIAMTERLYGASDNGLRIKTLLSSYAINPCDLQIGSI